MDWLNSNPTHTPVHRKAIQLADFLLVSTSEDEDRLVAVAGTHVVSQPEGIGVIGNVFTHPRYRGQGIGTLVTSAVTRELLTSGREVVLSVDPANDAAVRTYRRLGFREAARIIEGPAVRRDLGIVAFVRRRLAALRGRRYGAELVHLPE